MRDTRKVVCAVELSADDVMGQARADGDPMIATLPMAADEHR